ncbi:MAG: ELWxxDGT repeat protein, partial [Pirellulales bacterium]
MATRLHKCPGRQFERLEQRLALAAVPVVSAAGNPLRAPGELTVVGDELYFSATEAADPYYEYSARLWKTDGTIAGTMGLSQTTLTAYGPRQLTASGGRLFFVQSDQHGSELWVSDGTPGGTQLVSDIDPGPVGSGPQYLADVDGQLFFSGQWGTDAELWTSDGTDAGTRRVLDINPNGWSAPRELTDFHGTLLFIAYDDQHGYELWRSDGTAAGTSLVKDVRPGPEGLRTRDDYPFQQFTVAGDTLYFVADDGVHGRELWQTDGTETGTSLVKDIWLGDGSSQVAGLAAFEGRLYFGATDQDGDRELWSTDGTEAGTIRVTAISTGSGDTGVWIPPGAQSGDRLYFIAHGGPLNTQLWSTDGTPLGTQLVREFAGSMGGNFLSVELPSGMKTLFFAASDISNQSPRLWKTDGTTAGTVEVLNDLYGDVYQEIDKVVAFDGDLYFAGARVGDYGGMTRFALLRTPIVNVGPPVANAGGPYTVIEGQSLTLHAT